MSNALQTQSKADAAIQERVDAMAGCSVDEVHALLVEALSLTVEGVEKAAACVRFLEVHGADLSYVQPDMLDRLRKIAWGQLHPQVFLQFAGTRVERYVGRLAMPDQKRLAEGGRIETAVRRGGSFDKRMVSPLEMNGDQLRQVFSGDRIRTVPEQIAYLEATPEPVAPEQPRRKSRVEADARTATLKVGRTTVPVREVLGSLSDLAPIDHDADGPEGSVTIDADLYGPLQRMAAAGNKSVRHLVRLAILRTYFPGDAKVE